jgi:alpha-tubulin suppressor-like RCC1 family protein
MPVTYTYPYTQYTGIWKLNSASGAVGAGTWPNPPAPKLYSWGYNGAGGLGLGNTTAYSSPKQIGSLTTWLNLACGAYSSNSFGIKTDGTLWSWGYNAQGSLGLGNTTQYNSPMQVGALTSWLKISSAAYAVLAIKTNGTLWAWGDNTWGRLGKGNTTNYSSPVQVGSLTNWSSVSVGAYQCAAIKTDGTLWTWGYNGWGQLGLGNTTTYSSPKQVGSLTNWLQVATASQSILAVKTDGTLWAWGNNQYGQLGLNTTSYGVSSPTQIGALTNWYWAASSSIASAATQTNGTLWTWGRNASGQLGQGNKTGYSSPKQVGALTNWLQPFSITNANRFFATKTDGTLWGWGTNNYGALGLGNTTNYSSPKQVGTLTSWLTVVGSTYTTIGIAVN